MTHTTIVPPALPVGPSTPPPHPSPSVASYLFLVQPRREGWASPQPLPSFSRYRPRGWSSVGFFPTERVRAPLPDRPPTRLSALGSPADFGQHRTQSGFMGCHGVSLLGRAYQRPLPRPLTHTSLQAKVPPPCPPPPRAAHPHPLLPTHRLQTLPRRALKAASGLPPTTRRPPPPSNDGGFRA